MKYITGLGTVHRTVISYAEVWIEIIEIMSMYDCISSPPTRRCGLKSAYPASSFFCFFVTSYAEVWIEMNVLLYPSGQWSVTSCAEVWIEIVHICHMFHPTQVTSYAEVWIEINFFMFKTSLFFCHLLRGGVD